MAPGWIKLYRQALENGWLKNHRLWAFWSYCLLKASHKEVTVTVGYQRVQLLSGQFVFGRKQAAADLDMTERQIRTVLNRLISGQNLSVETTNKFSIVTVVNWNTYQGGSDDADHQNVQQVTNKCPASDHKQELKNEKNENKKNKSSSPDALRLSELLADMIVKNFPQNRTVSQERREKSVHDWAADIDKIIRIDQQTPQAIEQVILWSQSDDFWKANILSGSTLRKQWDRLIAKIPVSSEPATVELTPEELARKERRRKAMERQEAEEREEAERWEAMTDEEKNEIVRQSMAAYDALVEGLV